MKLFYSKTNKWGAVRVWIYLFIINDNAIQRSTMIMICAEVSNSLLRGYLNDGGRGSPIIIPRPWKATEKRGQVSKFGHMYWANKSVVWATEDIRNMRQFEPYARTQLFNHKWTKENRKMKCWKTLSAQVNFRIATHLQLDGKDTAWQSLVKWTLSLYKIIEHTQKSMYDM